MRELDAAAEQDVSVGGPDLAGQALAAGLVDELHLFVSPVVVGGGTGCSRRGPGRPRAADQRALRGGVVHLHYRTRS